MLTIRDHHSGDLFDPWAHLGEKRKRLLERSWAGVFREHLLQRLPVGELAPHFRNGFGRPSKDLYVAVGALVLQQMHDLTDAAAVEAVAFNIGWHYALDIRDESDAYISERTLRNYRRLIIDRNLDAVLFRNLTDQLIKAFGVDVSKQRLDSTTIRSAMRCLTRLGVVVETISKFLRELARTLPDLHAAVDPDLARRYVDREGAGAFASTIPSESKRRLPESGHDLLHLALKHRDTEAAKLDSFRLLEQVLSEQFEVVHEDDGDEGGSRVRIKEPNEIPCDNIRNPADPDSSYNAHRGQGYMTQVMETYQEDDGNRSASPQPDLITHVAVHKMTRHDGHQLEPALNDVTARDAKPQHLLADAHYGSNDNVDHAAQRGVALISPAITAKGAKEGKLTLEQFELDEKGLVTKCPGGHRPIAVSATAKRVQARFDQTLCHQCANRQLCPTRMPRSRGEGSRFQYTHERVAQRHRRLRERSASFVERYRWRAGIEGTMSRLKHQMHLAKLRVRGLAAVTYTVTMRALGLNIIRCGRFAPA